MSSEKRVCLQCRGEIPKWKSKGTKFCNPGCKFKFEKQEKEKRKVVNPKISSGSILHQCLSNALDAAIPCKCRKRISDEDAKKLIAKGGAVDYTTRAAAFVEGHPLLITGKHLKFPRAATIEKPMIERATQDLFTIKGKPRIKNRTIAEMEAVVKQDKMDRAEEEALRMEHYQALTVASMRIVQIPAEQYDDMKANDPWRGRCIFAASSDDRSSVSVDVPPGFETFNRWDAEVEEVSEDKPEIVKEEPEREDGLTVVSVEEMQEVAT